MRPRSSILDLFDPLASQDQSRDAPSPDSDKENCLDSDLSFFGRPAKAPSPLRLKRRLIDVGDITVDDPAIHPMLTEEDELDDSMCDDDSDTMTLRIPTVTPARDITVQKATSSHAGLRTPLAELSIDHEITPIARTKMYQRQPPSAFASSDSALPASSGIFSFASVIDAVTASGVSFAGSLGSSPDCELVNENQPENLISCEIETPKVTRLPIDEPSNAVSVSNLHTHSSEKGTTEHVASSPLSESSGTSISIEHPRSRSRSSPTNTPPRDQKRHSIDLYTSFHLQLQSEEASFDLLNDKISLFASTSSMDSFLNGIEEDDNFDMAVEEAKLQATIDSMQLEDGENKDSIDLLSLSAEYSFGTNSVNEIRDTQAHKQAKVFIASQSSSPQVPLSEHMKQREPRSSSLLRSTSSSPAPSQPTGDGNNTCPEIPKEIVSEPSTLPPVVCTPLHDDPDRVVLRTPAPNVGEQILPPPVHALRIVKRSARSGNEKSASTSSAASRRSALLTTIAPVTAPAKPISSPVTEHVSSTYVAHVGLPASEPSANLPPSRASNVRDNGPRRVPIIDSHPLATNKRRNLVDQRSMPQGNATGPRRVVVTPSVPVPPVVPVPAPAPGKASAVSGLKAPTKYGVGSSAAVSALPRPVSRLPTAVTSGVARPPRAGTGVNVARKGSIPANQGNKSTTYARRVA